MPRKKSHFEDKEPFLEKFLSNQRFRRVDKHIPANASLADLGCGYYGNHLKKVSKTIKHGTGLDISVSSKKPAKNITLINTRVDKKLPLKSDNYDIVTSLAVIEHLENPVKHIREARRILKPNGLLLITTPSEYAKPVIDTLAFKIGLISSEEISDHKRYYKIDSLEKDLTKAGFERKNINTKYFQLGLNIFSKSIK